MFRRFVQSITARLSEVFDVYGLADRRSVRLPLSVSLSGMKSAGGGAQPACAGHTCDLSDNGLSFILPTVLFGNRHIFNEGDCVLRIRLELPSGSINLNALPVRYDLIDGREAERGYLIGAQILGMDDKDRARYFEFLRSPLHNSDAAAQANTSNPAAAVSHTV